MVQSVSAGPLRQKLLKSQHRVKEKPRPSKLYDHGYMVYVNVPGLPFKNAVICGTEWGADHRDFKREVWLYYVRDAYSEMGSPMVLVAEDQITERVS